MSLDTLDKLKRNMRTGKVSMYDLFKEADINQNGKISSVEFRNIILKLNIGFSSTEIGQLMDFANVCKDGLVDWKSFVKRIMLK